jgi:hypothetical protein
MFPLTTDWHDWFAFGYGHGLRWMSESIGYCITRDIYLKSGAGPECDMSDSMLFMVAS